MVSTRAAVTLYGSTKKGQRQKLRVPFYNGIRTNVGSRATVLEVAVALSCDVARDTDRGTAVGDTRGESADVARLVPTGQPHLVVFTVDGDVFEMLLRQLFDGILDGLHSSGLAHGLGRVVGVATSAVPLALERLGMEGDLDTPLFGDTDEEEASHPEVVTHGDALAGSDLELPLGRHDLGVDSGDVDASIEASAVVGLDQVTSENSASSCFADEKWRGRVRQKKKTKRKGSQEST